MPGPTSAFLIIDVINPFDFEGAAPLLRETRGIVPTLRRLLEGTRAAGIPVIYCNDNFGRWRSDFRGNVEYCAREDGKGADVVRALLPAESDYFILKPKHSAFFETPLRLLLNQLGTERLLLAGIATDSCILSTGLDAYMREFEVTVARDAVAAQSAERSRGALDILASGRGIHIRDAQAALAWLAA